MPNVEPFTIHDFRRTARTHLAALGVDSHIFHVADLTNDRKGKNDARIKIFPDRQGGIVCNWKSNEQQSFFINNHRESHEPISPAERERIQAEQHRRQVKQQARQDKAAHRAQALW